MRRLYLIGLIFLCPLIARAQPQFGSAAFYDVGTSPGTICILSSTCAWGGTQISVSAYNAKPDAVWGVLDCVITASSNTVTCPNETFTAADVGKAFVAVDAGTSRNPLVTTIATYVSAHVITITATPTFSAPIIRITGLTPTAQGSGYTFGSTQTLTCSGGCSQITAQTGTPVVLGVVSATVSAGGSGGTNGTCTVTGTRGTVLAGQYFQASVTISGNAITAVGSITNGSNYTAYAVDPTQEPVTGCGLTGAKLSISFSVLVEAAVSTGLYTTTGPCTQQTAGATTSSDAGTGLTLKCYTNPSVASWGTDNTTPFKNGIAAVNVNSAKHLPTCLYIPAGNYMSNVLNSTLTWFGCILGDEHNNSNLFIIPNTAGDMLSVLDSGRRNSDQVLGGTITFSDATKYMSAGCSIRNLAIFGDRRSTAIQNGVMVYGKTEFCTVDRLSGYHIRGRLFGVGSDGVGGSFTESQMTNVTAWFTGDNSTSQPLPAIDLTSIGNVNGTNNVNLTNIRVYDNFGPHIVVRSCSDLNGAGHINIDGLHLEGSTETKLGATGDLLQLGDVNCASETFPTNTGGTVSGSAIGITRISSVHGTNLQFSNPPIGYAAVHIIADQRTHASDIMLDGAITGNDTVETSGVGTALGRCVQIDAGSNLTFRITTTGCADYDLQAVSFPNANSISAPISYDGQGNYTGFTQNVESTGLFSILFTTSAPIAPVANDVAIFSASGGLADSGSLLSSFVSSASPTFTGTVTFPDAGTWSSSGLSTTAAVTGLVGTTTNTSLTFRTNNVTRMVIANSGQVTTSPSWNDALANTNANGWSLANLAATATACTLIPNRSDSKAGICADTAGDVSLTADNAGTATEIARLTGTGMQARSLFTINNANSFILATQSSPASGAACTAGTITFDTGFFYACTASGAWKRAALTGGY